MPGFLVGLRAGDRVDLIAAGIEGARDPLDVAALAGRVPALISDDDRDLLAVKDVVKAAEFFLQAVQFFVIFILGENLVVQGYLGELGDRIQGEDVLPDGRRQGVILERRVDPLVEEAQDLELGPLLIARIDDIPRCGGAVRVLEVMLIDLKVFLVVLVLVKVIGDDSPACVLVRQQGFKALFLLFFADVEEELHHQVAVVGKRPLCGVDAADALLVIMLAQLAFHQLCGHFIHPVGVEKCEFSGFRDLQQISVQERVAFLFGSGTVHSLDPEEAGINTLDHPADDASFAGGAPALEDDHYRELRLFDLHLITGQLFPGLLEFLLKLFLFGLRGFDKIL